MTDHFSISTNLILAILCSGALCGCSDGPAVIESHTSESPNSTWVATLEEVDNGLGFGLGAVYDEVHLGKKGETIGAHGDKGRSVVFYVESTYGEGQPVTVRWLSDDRIQIVYDGSHIPGKKETLLKGVAIEYQTHQK